MTSPVRIKTQRTASTSQDAPPASVAWAADAHQRLRQMAPDRGTPHGARWHRVMAVLPTDAAEIEADTVPTLAARLLTAAGLPEAGQTLSRNTLHYYRKRDLVPAPLGPTTKGGYSATHALCMAAARAAGETTRHTLQSAAAALASYAPEHAMALLLECADAADAVAPSCGAPSAENGATQAAASSAYAPGAWVHVQLPDAITLTLPSEHPAFADPAARFDLLSSLSRAIADHG